VDPPLRRLLAGPVLEVAPQLLGLVVETSDGRAVRLVEVEAYGGDEDPASHAAGGRRRGAASMWGPPGRAYVYRSYGVHWCLNVVVAPEGRPAAVLLRAGEPVAGLDSMRAARRTGRPDAGCGPPDRDLCRGPGRLAQALAVDAGHDGADLLAGTGWLHLSAAHVAAGRPGDVLATTRIGISRNVGLPARFVLAGSPWVSHPRWDGAPDARARVALAPQSR